MKRLLIAEDDYILSFVLKKMAMNLGFETIVTVRTGREALEKISSVKPDFILMDVILDGEISGVQVIEKIRKVNNIPVIFVTAQCDETIFNKIKKISNSSLLLKPIIFRELQLEFNRFCTV